MHEPRSKFQKAVEACPDLTFRDGLQAITAADRDRVRTKDPRSVTGSADIDNDLRRQVPQDNRWDYAVSYQCILQEANPQICKVFSPGGGGEFSPSLAHQGLPHPVAWAIKEQQVSVMNKAIDHGGGHLFVVEDSYPSAEF